MVGGYVDDSNLALNDEGVKRFNKIHKRKETMKSATRKAYQG